MTVRRLERYMYCPMQDKFLAKEGRKSLQEEWEEALGSVIRWYFFKILDAQRPGREEVLERWEKAWFKGKKPLEIMLKGLDQRSQWGIRGIRMLDKFLQHAEPVPGRPLAVAQSISFSLGQVELSGEIPLVREVTEGGKRIIEIVHYRTSSMPDSLFWIESDLELAFASWAFRELYGSREGRSRVVYLNDGNEATLKVDDNLRQRFIYTVRCLLPQIERREAWPRTGPHCRICTYRRQCIESWRD